MAGLVCADALRGDVTVFEKSRGIGGRLATRAVTTADGRPVAFDHGTPGIRPAESLFAGLLSDLADAGTAAEWRGGLVVGLPGMRDLLSPLAEGLDIRFEARVDALRRDGDGWRLTLAPHEREGGTATGEERPFDRVVLALPAPQARSLLAPIAPALAAALEPFEAEPSWTLMAAFDGGTGEPAAGGMDGAEWLIREHEKPGRTASPRAYTLQMSAEWSAERLELERETVLPLMMEILRRRSGETGAPLVAMAHRWRYARTGNALGEAFLEADGLVVGGDWALGNGAEHAWASGKAIAQALL